MPFMLLKILFTIKIEEKYILIKTLIQNEYMQTQKKRKKKEKLLIFFTKTLKNYAYQIRTSI